jgi:hypothetical protein
MNKVENGSIYMCIGHRKYNWDTSMCEYYLKVVLFDAKVCKSRCYRASDTHKWISSTHVPLLVSRQRPYSYISAAWADNSKSLVTSATNFEPAFHIDKFCVLQPDDSRRNILSCCFTDIANIKYIQDSMLQPAYTIQHVLYGSFPPKPSVFEEGLALCWQAVPVLKVACLVSIVMYGDCNHCLLVLDLANWWI